PYRDIDEAVRLANASTNGLGGSVWGGDGIDADTTGLELDDLLAEVARGEPEAITWRGTQADEAAERWSQR
ncbi:MAG: hypothetical protein HUU35_14980, partial [Armatimonadetes bacterium]|nr:hypothetical protein [Armatimonadota bacterium]